MNRKRAARAHCETPRQVQRVSADSRTRVSKYALKILTKMAAGARGTPIAHGGMKVATLSVPENLTRELLGRDLISRYRGAEGGALGYQISSAGEGYLRRANAKKDKARIRGAEAGAEADDFRKQHQVDRMQRIGIGKTNTRVKVNGAESPLGWLYRRRRPDGSRLLEDAHLCAADRLRADYEMANLGARVTSAYDGLPVSKKRSHLPDAPIPMRMLAARERYNQAMDAMGPGLADIVTRVCCQLEGMEHAERGMNWPARAGKIVLRIGLDRLIEHYEKTDFPE